MGFQLKLFWFYDKEEYLWWFCLWFNPDFFENIEDKKIINNLLNNNYDKISCYYIVDKYKWMKIWAKYLSNFLKENKYKYFLTCNLYKLKEYYISLWFKLINNNKDKHILTFD